VVQTGIIICAIAKKKLVIHVCRVFKIYYITEYEKEKFKCLIPNDDNQNHVGQNAEHITKQQNPPLPNVQIATSRNYFTERAQIAVIITVDQLLSRKSDKTPTQFSLVKQY